MGSNGKRREATASKEKQQKAAENHSALISIDEERIAAQHKAKTRTIRRSAFRAPAAQRGEQHRPAGTRSLASHTRTKRNDFLVGLTPLNLRSQQRCLVRTVFRKTDHY